MRLDEILNSPVEINYNIRGHDGINQAIFTVSNGIEYAVYMLPHYMVADQLYMMLDFEDDEIEGGMFVEFEQTQAPMGKNKEITNTGKAFEVFNGVLAAIKKMVATLKPKYLYFQAAEPSRQKLYDRLVKILANEFGWKVHTKNGFYVTHSPDVTYP